MRVEFFPSGNIQQIVDRIRGALEREGFIFAENERTYAVHYPNGRVEKTQTGSKSWARKQLADPYPLHFSIEIEGEAVQEGGNPVIRANFVEFQANRKHEYGGSHALDSHVDLFCEIFQE